MVFRSGQAPREGRLARSVAQRLGRFGSPFNVRVELLLIVPVVCKRGVDLSHGYPRKLE